MASDELFTIPYHIHDTIDDEALSLFIAYIRCNKNNPDVISRSFVKYKDINGFGFESVYMMLNREDDVETFITMIHVRHILFEYIQFRHVSLFALLRPITWDKKYDEIIFEIPRYNNPELNIKMSTSTCYLKAIQMLEDIQAQLERMCEVVKRMASHEDLVEETTLPIMDYNLVNYMIKYGEFGCAIILLNILKNKSTYYYIRHSLIHKSMISIHSESELFLEQRKQLLIRIVQHKLFEKEPKLIIELARSASPWSIRIILKYFNIFKIYDFSRDCFIPNFEVCSIINNEGCLIKLVLDPFNCTNIHQSIVDRIDFFLKNTKFPEDIIIQTLNFEFGLYHQQFSNALQALLRRMVFEESSKQLINHTNMKLSKLVI